MNKFYTCRKACVVTSASPNALYILQQPLTEGWGVNCILTTENHKSLFIYVSTLFTLPMRYTGKK